MLTAKLHYENDTLTLTGDVNFDNVMQLYHQSLAIFQSSHVAVVDLLGVSSNTSAILALLIEWKKLSKNQAIQIINLPAKLNQITNTAGLLDLFA